MCWTTYTHQYRISVRRLMSLHMFVVNVIVAFFFYFLLFFLSALCRVVPDPEAILLCQGPGMSMRTMCMRMCMRTHWYTYKHLHVYMYISAGFLRTRMTRRFFCFVLPDKNRSALLHCSFQIHPTPL